uniref:Uncharacterized protein LOC111132221 n=1 Tax=Crassostrea virginica TaxID=6565 RepID=A0A8B8E7X6_CRAVI|nr:uncharacterized protein LOC111132221 [Crassostrea virginica]
MEGQKIKKSVGSKLFKQFSVRDGEIPMVGKKASKPITEKRRRDRINKCLVQLKNIVMRATGKDEKRFAKMEKADILEMTIGHLVEIHQQKIGKRFVDHWGIATPGTGNPSDPFSCTRRTKAADKSPEGRAAPADPSYHLDHLLPTPAYRCGYSGDKAIMGVKFEEDDYMETDSIMCGSASRVFVFGEDDAGMRSENTTDMGGPLSHHSLFPKDWTHPSRTNRPLLTSTPVEFSASKPIRTSTPLDLPSLSKGFLSPEELFLSGRYDINLNTSPDLRVRLFTSSEESSDGSSARKSFSGYSGSGASSTGTSDGSTGENVLWRPW